MRDLSPDEFPFEDSYSTAVRANTYSRRAASPVVVFISPDRKVTLMVSNLPGTDKRMATHRHELVGVFVATKMLKKEKYIQMITERIQVHLDQLGVSR